MIGLPREGWCCATDTKVSFSKVSSESVKNFYEVMVCDVKIESHLVCIRSGNRSSKIILSDYDNCCDRLFIYWFDNNICWAFRSLSADSPD